MDNGLILCAHGARDPNWATPFEAVAERVRQAGPNRAVMLAYLEFMTPSLGEAASVLVAQGCGRVAVLPLFLGAGGHVRKHLPTLVEQLRLVHPAVRFHLHQTVGEIESVIAAMAQAALSALEDGQ